MGEIGKNMEEKVVRDLRNEFYKRTTLSIEYRLEQLENLYKMYEESTEEILQALYDDLRKPKFEGLVYELELLKNDAKAAVRELKKWTSPEKLPVNLLMSSDRAFIQPQPFGVVLILGAWNYPFLLSLRPLCGAIAAGNCVIVKPSEISTSSSATINKIITKYLDQKCYRVIQGGVEETTRLLAQNFDYIFATGSTTVGRIVMEAAAKNLTPVTLELGGKSPVYIHDSADIEMAAKRIIWGKLINLGQTCIAPDYVITSKANQAIFVKIAKEVLSEWYGSDQKTSNDLTRIVNNKHFKRLQTLLDKTKGKIGLGGEVDEDQLWIPPTIIAVEKNDILMDEEIFGPILPFLAMNSPQEALQFINSRPKPLALYVFAKDEVVQEMFLSSSFSGSLTLNDVVIQNGWENLPFGGVGESGIGRYHGKYSFDTFSHKKSVVVRDFGKMNEKLGSVRYPPYTENKIQFVSFVLRNFRHFELNGVIGGFLGFASDSISFMGYLLKNTVKSGAGLIGLSDKPKKN